MEQPQEKMTHYKLLEIRADATPDEIEKGYKKQVKLYHPDKRPDKVEDATYVFRAIRTAYETLSDPEKRRCYDQSLEDDRKKREFDSRTSSPNISKQNINRNTSESSKLKQLDPEEQFKELMKQAEKDVALEEETKRKRIAEIARSNAEKIRNAQEEKERKLREEADERKQIEEERQQKLLAQQAEEKRRAEEAERRAVARRYAIAIRNREIEVRADIVRQERGFTCLIQIINERLLLLKHFTNDPSQLQEEKYTHFKEDIISLSKEIAQRELDKGDLKSFAVIKSIEDIRNRGLELKNYYETKKEELENPQSSIFGRLVRAAL